MIDRTALGYHKLSDENKGYFEEFFDASQILPISQVVINQAVKLKQIKKMSLGDAIIAGTALVYDLTVVTVILMIFGGLIN